MRARSREGAHPETTPRAACRASASGAAGDDGIVERLAFPHERGHAVTLAPRADDLHSRGARSSWSEGSGDSTAAYATRSRPPDRHFWVATIPGEGVSGAVSWPACGEHASS